MEKPNYDFLSDAELNKLQLEVQIELSRLSILHTYLIEERILRAEKQRGKRP